MKELAETVATVARVGYMRPAPGTWGSLAAVPLIWAIDEAGGLIAVAVAIICAFVAGIWATREMTRGKEDHDPSEIVIDEVVGQWIALLPVLIGAYVMGVPSTDLQPGWIAGFVFFRLFDIWKPWLVGKFDRRGDALGVMMDDVVAGIFAAIAVCVLAGVAHGVLMG